MTDTAMTEFGYAYVWLDGDGTQHYFKDVDNVTNIWEDEDGLNLTLSKETIAGVDYLYLSDKDDNLFIFKESNGLLYYITDNLPDSSNAVIKRVNYIRLDYNGTILQAVYDTNNKKIASFEYNSYFYLTQIKDKADRVTQFSYNTAFQLTSIQYPDNTQIQFSYDGRGNMIQIANAQNQRLVYTYQSGSSRVTSISQLGYAGTQGQSIQLSFLTPSATGFTYTTRSSEGFDHTMTEMYEFDRYGRVFNMEDLDGGATSCVYTPSDNDKTKNRITSASSTEKAVNNLLIDPSCESASNRWVAYTGVNGGGAKSIVTGTAYLGQKLMRLSTQNGGSESGNIGYTQNVKVKPNTYYTLSAYIKGIKVLDASTDSYSASCAKLIMSAYNGATFLETKYSDAGTSNTDENGWQRLVLTFQTPDNTDNISVGSYLNGYYAMVYFDCFQLEEGESANAYTMLQNADFSWGPNGHQQASDDSSMPIGWTAVNCDLSGSDGRIAGSSLTTTYGFSISGDRTKIKQIYQEVMINKPAKDLAFSATCKAQGFSLPNLLIPRTFGFRLRFYLTDENNQQTVELSDFISFNTDTESLQTMTKAVRVSKANEDKTLGKVEFILEYGNNANHANFYLPQLKMDLTGTNYTYDNEGNLISATDNAGRNATYDYSTTTQNLTKLTDPEGDETEYTYSETNPHQVVSIRQNATLTKLDVEYDDYGNVVQSTYGSTWSTDKIVTSAATQNNGYHPSYSVDARGKKTMYYYQANKNLLTSVMDASGYYTYYSYDANNDRLTKVSKTSYVPQLTIENSYSYDNSGRLTYIHHNNFFYNNNYNQFGNLSYVRVGTSSSGQTLASYAYYDKNGPLKTTVYGNGHTVGYTYDNLDRLQTVAYNGVESWEYVYDAKREPVQGPVADRRK